MVSCVWVCNCGAVTFTVDNGKTYSIRAENIERYLPPSMYTKSADGTITITAQEYMNDIYNCDHCVNHYGLDICACGSGESPEACDNEYDVCGRPMQRLGAYTQIVAAGAWSAYEGEVF